MPNQGRGAVTNYDAQGDFVVYDKSGNIIAEFDATNRKLIIPSGSEIEIAGTLDAQAGATVAGVLRFAAASASKFGFGDLEEPTIATGVLTVTKPFVNPLPESSTSDQVDSIVYTGAAEGDLLLIHVPATNTITFDDANINLAAATRAVAPGGSLLLVYDGTQWSEVLFTAATDNA